MRTTIIAAVFLIVGAGCQHRSLVCVHNVPDWYEPDSCSYGRSEPLIEVAFITRTGRPLKGRRIHVVEVSGADSCTRINAHGNDLLLYSDALVDARLLRFILTDEQGRAVLRFVDHRVGEFSETGIWSKGPHLFRFSRTAPERGMAKLAAPHQLSGRQARRSTMARVTLCPSGCRACTTAP